MTYLTCISRLHWQLPSTTDRPIPPQLQEAIYFEGSLDFPLGGDQPIVKWYFWGFPSKLVHCLGSLYNDPSAFGGRKQKITWCFDRFVCNEHLGMMICLVVRVVELPRSDTFLYGSFFTIYWPSTIQYSKRLPMTDPRKGVSRLHTASNSRCQKTGILVCLSLATRIITST